MKKCSLGSISQEEIDQLEAREAAQTNRHLPEIHEPSKELFPHRPQARAPAGRDLHCRAARGARCVASKNPPISPGRVHKKASAVILSSWLHGTPARRKKKPARASPTSVILSDRLSEPLSGYSGARFSAQLSIQGRLFGHGSLHLNARLNTQFYPHSLRRRWLLDEFVCRRARASTGVGAARPRAGRLLQLRDLLGTRWARSPVSSRSVPRGHERSTDPSRLDRRPGLSPIYAYRDARSGRQ